MNTNAIIIAKLEGTEEALAAIARILEVDVIDVGVRGNEAFANTDDDWFRDGVRFMPPEDFINRFLNEPYERGYNAAQEDKMLSQVFKRGRDVELAPARTLTPKEAADRAEMQASMRDLPLIHETLAAFEKELAATRPKVDSGELTREALKRIGEKMRPWQLRLEKYNGVGDSILLDTCTDPKLLAERAALTAHKRMLNKRMAQAKNMVDSFTEEVHRARQQFERLKAAGNPANEVATAERHLREREADVAGSQAELDEHLKDLQTLQVRLDANRVAMKLA